MATIDNVRCIVRKTTRIAKDSAPTTDTVVMHALDSRRLNDTIFAEIRPMLRGADSLKAFFVPRDAGNSPSVRSGAASIRSMFSERLEWEVGDTLQVEFEYIEHASGTMVKVEYLVSRIALT